jgi:hypothetical protein
VLTEVARYVVMCGLVVLVGCSGPDDGGAAPVAPSMPPHDGPPFDFEVTPEDPGTRFRWTVTVPTGGWEVRFDGSQNDPRVGHFIIMLLLTRPGPDEMVTEALEKHEGEYRHGRQTAVTAELLVRTVTRGSTEEGELRSAATWSARN